MESLKNKTIKGVSWSFIDNIASSGVSFLVGIILARILTPDEFGILGMITIFIAISNSIVDSGFSNALIRKTNPKSEDYNTVFYFNLIIGIIFYFILYISSPIISRFFNEPILIPITRTMGSILIINALGIIQRTLLIIKVDFKTQTKVSIIASVTSGIIGIFMAIFEFGIWSLVGQQISRQLLNTVFLWIYSKWRPIIEFSTNSFLELFNFGSKLLLSGLIDTIYRNIYYIIIGRFYSAAQLGQYTRSEQFNTIFSSNLTTIVQRVSYPVLSSIQNDSVRLQNAYQKIIKTTMLFAFACMLGLAAISKPLIIILIGEKWITASIYLQIICFSGMLYPLQAINLNILQVKGRSDLLLKLEIIKKISAIIPILLGILYGIEFMLLGSVLNSGISYFINSYYSAYLVNYSTNKQIKDIFPSFIVSLSVALIMWSITLINLSNYTTLIIQCLIGISLAIIIYEKIKLEEYLEIKKMILSFIHKK